MAQKVGGPTAPHSFRRPAAVAAPVARARHFHSDPTAGRRLEQATARAAPTRSQFEEVRAQLRSVERRLEHAKVQAAAPRRHFGAGSSARPDIVTVEPRPRVTVDPRPRVTVDPRPRPRKKPAGRIDVIKEKLEHNLLRLSAVLFMVGAVGWCLLLINQLRAPVAISQPASTIAKADSEIDKTLTSGSSSYVRTDQPRAPGTASQSLAEGESPASVVAREWSRLEARPEPKVAERPRAPASAAKPPVKEAKLSAKPAIRLASLEGAEPEMPVIPSRIPPNVGALTKLVDFENAPFPYRGMMPGSGRPFLNTGEQSNRGHVNFRGRVLWESKTFGDDHVLLHIPPGFDPRRPAVMVVFFHGHGATLARDVRDRQQVPEQITAAGVNAVLVAPQFAVDAADSSAGKFWEPNGFKRFLDEAAIKLAKIYGDPRSSMAFANMPIVLVSYSGGFGPTLSVLDRGGVRSRVRGLVMLDSLYGGFDKFADWIAQNRSAFFISSYTPHTAGHNSYLEQLLRERSVPYGSELRRGHLEGMVTFLPAGPISHRDFVNHAWTDFPIRDVLVRMDNVDPRIDTASSTASVPATAAARN